MKRNLFLLGAIIIFWFGLHAIHHWILISKYYFPADVTKPNSVDIEGNIYMNNLNDPFEGIETDDINEYADLYNIAPPENDKEAEVLAKKIKKWVSDGRPNL